uniref:Dynein light chain n=1 Tax=Salvator merianae TaxID=96440 RepID=A0A8D0C4F1_SALMN
MLQFKEQDCDLAQIEVDEVLCLVRYIAAEIPAHDAVPSRVVFLVKFLKKLPYLFNIRRNVFLYVIFLHGLGRTIHGVLLHVLGHVRIFDHSLPVRHDGPAGREET